jgi:hypothetical protein
MSIRGNDPLDNRCANPKGHGNFQDPLAFGPHGSNLVFHLLPNRWPSEFLPLGFRTGKTRIDPLPDHRPFELSENPAFWNMALPAGVAKYFNR